MDSIGIVTAIGEQHPHPFRDHPEEWAEALHVVCLAWRNDEAAPGMLLLQTRLLRSGLAVAIATRTNVAGAALVDRRMTAPEKGIAELIVCRTTG